MEYEKKYLANPESGGLNADSDDFAVAPDEWVNMQNMRVGTTDKGVTDVIESIGGTAHLGGIVYAPLYKIEMRGPIGPPSTAFALSAYLIILPSNGFYYILNDYKYVAFETLSYPVLPIMPRADQFKNLILGGTELQLVNFLTPIGYVTDLYEITPLGINLTITTYPFATLSSLDYVIGHATDEANNRLCWFHAASSFFKDAIFCYDKIANLTYLVLQDDQVTGGLGFDRNKLIHSARIVNGLLYWTDNNNQPRRINIEAGIKTNYPVYNGSQEAYTIPLNPEVITVIRKPPVYPLILQKQTDGDIDTNEIKNNAFRFAYRYRYRDGEQSTLSDHSLLAPYNFPDEDFNQIRITVSASEIPDQDVQVIDIVVIYVDGEQAFVVKTWDKNNPTDAAEIAAHVAGSQQLTYLFNNDSVGEAIDAAYKVKPFDRVPLRSEGLEQTNNRLFLARNLIGYDTPNQTSLSAQIFIQDADAGINGQWALSVGSIIYGPNPEDQFDWSCYFAFFPVDIDATHPAGFYDLTGPYPAFAMSHTDLGSLPSTIDIDDYTWICNEFDGIYGGGIFTYVQGTVGLSGNGGGNADPTGGPVVTADNTPITGNTTILKSDSPYGLGVVFYDQYLRQCGVVTNIGSTIRTPDREYTLSSVYNYGIQWNLNTGAQPLEIPDWARYYSIVTTKSLRASYFLQARTSQIIYARKDADGVYVFDTNAWAETLAGIAIKLDILQGYGMGYSFQQGDICKIYIDGDPTIYVLEVIDQTGDYVILQLADIGTTSSLDVFFEIYTPTAKTAAHTYYEVGQMFAVLNPGLSTRSYSVTSGVLPGDVYLLTRLPGDYLTETMSPSTVYWRNWFTNAGRVQIVDRIGQQQKETSIVWSNTFIPGTRTNGLSTFDALDERILTAELGPIRKLQITSKVANELGIVMLAICEQETCSLYLGEVQLFGSNQPATLTQSPSVIGTVNTLKGSYGTINPESVIEYRGGVYWVDAFNGRVIQYSVNGLFPISDYRMRRFWKLLCDQYRSMTVAQIEALGSRPFFFATVDPYHNELLITVPRVLSVPPKGFLPDYPSTGYPFDIYDGQSKTIVYKIGNNPRFLGSYSFTPEQFVTLQNQLYSFRFGTLYLHNQTNNYCQFYFQQFTSRIMIIGNQNPNWIKTYKNISLQVNLIPVLTYLFSQKPFQQASDLLDFDYDDVEGFYYSAFYRNKLIPTATGKLTTGLLTQEEMRTYALRVMIEWSVTTTPAQLRFVNIGYVKSKGHST